MIASRPANGHRGENQCRARMPREKDRTDPDRDPIPLERRARGVRQSEETAKIIPRDQGKVVR